MLICLFTSSTLWALGCMSLPPPLCLSVCLASLAQGLHEHRYYKAVLNNRSFLPVAAEGQSNGERRRTDTNMAAQTPQEWGTLLEGCNLLGLSLSAAHLFVGSSPESLRQRGSWRGNPNLHNEQLLADTVNRGKERFESGVTAKQQRAT